MNIDELFSEQNLLAACSQFVVARTDKLEAAVGKHKPKVRIPTGVDKIDYTILLDMQSNRRKLLLKRISNLVTTGRYIFSPFREKSLPKPDGGTRTISISTVRDALVQFVLLPGLEGALDKNFSNSCFGYRTGKSANKAISVIKRNVKKGWNFILDGDITAFFDTVPHQPLIESFRKFYPGGDPRLAKLIRAYLKSKRIAASDFVHGKWMKLKGPINEVAQPREIGLPQGGALSGFLTNIYLSSFDKAFDSQPGRFKLVRYADDFVVLCRSAKDVQLARALATDNLQQLGLALHPGKTHETDTLAGFNFLGYRFRSIKKLETRIKSSTLSKRYQKLRSLFREAEESDWCSCKLRYRLNLRLVGVDREHKMWKKKIEKNSQIDPELLTERSWIRYFTSLNGVGQLRKMDKWVIGKLLLHAKRYYDKTEENLQLERCWCRKHTPKRLLTTLLRYVREFYRLRDTKKTEPKIEGQPPSLIDAPT